MRTNMQDCNRMVYRIQRPTNALSVVWWSCEGGRWIYARDIVSKHLCSASTPQTHDKCKLKMVLDLKSGCCSSPGAMQREEELHQLMGLPMASLRWLPRLVESRAEVNCNMKAIHGACVSPRTVSSAACAR
jgi:hypothetical protein